MSVLVNGSPTKDFEVGRGLRQGDSLSSFLFVLVDEGLTGLISKVVVRGEFDGFRVKEGLTLEIIQFADDTLFIESGGWKNLWCLKAVLRSFELVTGLSVNFCKSKLIGINVSHHFLIATSNFLACKMDGANFEFQGISIGVKQEGLRYGIQLLINSNQNWIIGKVGY